MGKALDKFRSQQENLKKVGKKVPKVVKNTSAKIEEIQKNAVGNKHLRDHSEENRVASGFGDDEFEEDFNNGEAPKNDDYMDGEDYPIQQAQKPASFFHFILENQYTQQSPQFR